MIKKMAGNSRTFYKRRSYYRKKTGKKNPRVPRRSYKKSEDHSDLFTDENPKGTVKGMKFKNKKEAVKSIKKLKSLYKRKKITYAHMRQIGTTMEQRSRYHSHPTKDIKEASKVWKRFNRSFKK
jgi:hypothetical protein